MNARATILTILALVTGAGERVTTIDLRNDPKDSGYYVAFYARYESVGSLRGDAIAMLGTGNSPEEFAVIRAYGLHLVPGRMRLGPVTTAELDAVRALKPSDTAPPPELFLVRIDSTQYAAVDACFDEWDGKRSFDYPIETEFAHFSESVFKASGLFPPYRATFRPFSPIEFYVDLRRLNERMGRSTGPGSDEAESTE